MGLKFLVSSAFRFLFQIIFEIIVEIILASFVSGLKKKKNEMNVKES